VTNSSHDPRGSRSHAGADDARGDLAYASRSARHPGYESQPGYHPQPGQPDYGTPGPRGGSHGGGARDGGAYGGSRDGGVYGGARDGGVYGGSRDDGVYGGSRDGGVYGGSRDGGVYGGARSQSGSGGSDRRPPNSGGPGTGRPRSGKPGGNGRKKKRSPLWTKVSITFGSVIMLAAVAGIIAVPTLLHQVAGEIKTGNYLADDTVSGASIDGAINMLLVGLDTRPDNSIGTRSDSIIIAHIPKNHQGVYLISIPRDTDADIPAYPKTHAAQVNLKINAAFQRGSMNGGGEAGGFDLLAKTIQKNYGIQFQGGAIVNFDGFTDIVKRLGGVDMYVDELTTSIHHGYVNGDRSQHAKPFNINPNTGVPKCPGNYSFDRTPLKCALPGVTPVQYKVGFQHLSAYDALDFVRCRDGLPYTDYDRQRHQQQFIKALMKGAYNKGMSDPTKLASFVSSISKAFTLVPGKASTEKWIFTLKAINPGSIVTIKTNNGKYVHYDGPAPDSRQALNADSMQLLRTVVSDKVDTFVATHPDWVANS
jgi:LCP family protein required for cell wall assembly